jgi:hypothetical protein
LFMLAPRVESSAFSCCLSARLHERTAEPFGGDEPPPRFSVPSRVPVRERFLRSTVRVGGGRSPQSLGIVSDAYTSPISLRALVASLAGGNLYASGRIDHSRSDSAGHRDRCTPHRCGAVRLRRCLVPGHDVCLWLDLHGRDRTLALVPHSAQHFRGFRFRRICAMRAPMPNHSREPMPGDRFGYRRTSVARHGSVPR